MPDTKQLQKIERRAAKADLVYLNSMGDGIVRVRCGRGFTYKTATGKTVTAQRVRKRIESLVIPPAWNDVVIAKQSNGHIQAVGTDEAGRKQYIYHDRWHAISQITKFDRMHLFGKLLPRIRRRVRKDLKSKRLCKTCVVAAVVRLLDKGHLRIGNQSYVDRNGSHGATTLFPEHVEIDDGVVSLDFPGKSGKQRSVKLSDKLVAKVIDKCEEIDGQFLFQYHDDEEEPQTISSSDVNEYLQDVSGESISAKDFRTWSGSTTALAELSEVPSGLKESQRKKHVREAVSITANELGNTKAVCRSSYIHPGILIAAETGELSGILDEMRVKSVRELTAAEELFLAILPKLEFT